VVVETDAEDEDEVVLDTADGLGLIAPRRRALPLILGLVALVAVVTTAVFWGKGDESRAEVLTATEPRAGHRLDETEPVQEPEPVKAHDDPPVGLDPPEVSAAVRSAARAPTREATSSPLRPERPRLDPSTPAEHAVIPARAPAPAEETAPEPAQAPAAPAVAEEAAPDTFAEGQAAYDRGEYATAVDLLERAVRQSATPPKLLALGLAYARTGREADARRAWARVLETEPDHPLAMRYLRALAR
jgi:hypothetical protein